MMLKRAGGTTNNFDAFEPASKRVAQIQPGNSVLKQKAQSCKLTDTVEIGDGFTIASAWIMKSGIKNGRSEIKNRSNLKIET